MDQGTKKPTTEQTLDAWVRPHGRRTRYIAADLVLGEGGAGKWIRASVVALCVTLVATVGWAAVTELDETALATGEIITAGNVRAVQHLEGGIVAQMYVEEGELVEAGQPLLRFDAAQARAELDRALGRLASLQTTARRLVANSTLQAPDFAELEHAHPSLVASQRAIYTAQRATYDSALAILQQQIRSRESELVSLERREASTARQIAFMTEEVDMRRALFEQNHGSKLLLVNAQRSLAETQGELETLRGEASVARATINELMRRVTETEERFVEEALKELASVQTEQVDLEDLITSLDDRVVRLIVRAPVRGIVQSVPLKTEQGVVPPGGIVAELVPASEPLLAEAEVSTQDIGFVSVGQAVTVKVQTYNFARYGSIEGTLEAISATTFEDENGQPFYRGRVRLDQDFVGANPNKHRLLPGMTVQVDIHTGSKTLLEYLLKPIYTNLNESFRER